MTTISGEAVARPRGALPTGGQITALEGGLDRSVILSADFLQIAKISGSASSPRRRRDHDPMMTT
jgi:hypothetical protein